MSNIYNILWVDDEHNDEAMLPFIVQAESQGIILDGYKSFKEGFNVLESNLNKYDVILLDALFYEDETSETPNPAGLGSAIQKINELRSKKSFPFFVLSGQTHFTDATNPILEAFKIRCYNKKNPDDVKELLKNIKQSVIVPQGQGPPAAVPASALRGANPKKNAGSTGKNSVVIKL